MRSKPDLGKPVLGAGTLAIITKDTPAARAFIDFLKTPIAHEIWMAQSGFLTPFKGVNTDAYGNEPMKKEGEILLNATTFRFDGSDLMPGKIGAGAFWTGMVDFVGGKPRRRRRRRHPEELGRDQVSALPAASATDPAPTARIGPRRSGSHACSTTIRRPPSDGRRRRRRQNCPEGGFDGAQLICAFVIVVGVAGCVAYFWGANRLLDAIFPSRRRRRRRRAIDNLRGSAIRPWLFLGPALIILDRLSRLSGRRRRSG